MTLMFSEADLYNAHILQSVSRRNTYFTGGLARSNGIEDDHIPFLNKSECVITVHISYCMAILCYIISAIVHEHC